MHTSDLTTISPSPQPLPAAPVPLSGLLVFGIMFAIDETATQDTRGKKRSKVRSTTGTMRRRVLHALSFYGEAQDYVNRRRKVKSA